MDLNGNEAVEKKEAVKQTTAHKKHKATKTPDKPKGPLVYIGPNLPGGKMAAFTVFRYELPSHIEALADKAPEIRRLIVPVANMSEAQTRARTQGTAEYRAVQNLLKGES